MRKFNGDYHIVGSSPADHTASKEWACMIIPEAANYFPRRGQAPIRPLARLPQTSTTRPPQRQQTGIDILSAGSTIPANEHRATPEDGKLAW